jgi:hypothetical protein
VNASGLVDKVHGELSCTDDRRLAQVFGIGLTNLVKKLVRRTSFLTKEDSAPGIPELNAKIRKYRPPVRLWFLSMIFILTDNFFNFIAPGGRF